MLKIWLAASLAFLMAGPSMSAPPLESQVSVHGHRAIISEGDQLEQLRLTFAEDFDTFSRFDGRRGFWRTNYGFAGPDSFGGRTMPWHAEEQLYVHAGDRGSGRKALGINPFVLRHGKLEITAARTTPQQAKSLWNYGFTSGLITSQGAFSQTYGYFEMRARLPAGRGYWPAFWLCANDSWPPEIDVVETLGHDPTTVYMTTHFGQGDAKRDIGKTFTAPDTSAGFHIYGMAWSPTKIRYFFDRKEVAEIPTPPGVDKPMYLLANLAVGGHWPGKPDETTPSPARLIIDYINVYQFENLPRPSAGVVRPSTYQGAAGARK